MREKTSAQQRRYAEFLAEADRLLFLGIRSKASDPVEFHVLLEKLTEIQLFAPKELADTAKQIVDYASHAVEERENSSKSRLFPVKAKFIALAKSESKSYEN